MSQHHSSIVLNLTAPNNIVFSFPLAQSIIDRTIQSSAEANQTPLFPMVQQRNHSRSSLFVSVPGTLLALVIATCLSHPAFGEGFRILDQSAAAMAQGGAFAAQADDPSSVHYNPAAITDPSGLQLTVGTLLVSGGIDFRPASGPAIEGDFGGTFANPPPSSFFVTARLGDLMSPSFDPWTLGLGVYAPFGNITRYPRSSASPLSSQEQLRRFWT